MGYGLHARTTAQKKCQPTADNHHRGGRCDDPHERWHCGDFRFYSLSRGCGGVFIRRRWNPGNVRLLRFERVELLFVWHKRDLENPFSLQGPFAECNMSGVSGINVFA